MKKQIIQYQESTGWAPTTPAELSLSPDLVFVFGSNELIQSGKEIYSLAEEFPDSIIVGCSTAGEIFGTSVQTESLVATCVSFGRTDIVLESVYLEETEDSFDAGERLANQLSSEELQHVFVLSDGLSVNGTKLVRGLDTNLPENVMVSGGLAGDADRFNETRLILNGTVESKAVGAVGFYGKNLDVGYGSFGGWDPFGPERLVTHSEGNLLYELDDKPALDLYKKYLGDHADELPFSGLLFPLSIRDPESNKSDSLVRTILSVDESEKSMTFAGDIPEGYYARLMKANFDRLIQGAKHSAESTFDRTEGSETDLAILISCVGRRLILKQRTEEELEAVRDVLGEGAFLSGFYSYGEISPSSESDNEFCELHNQTMTITTLSEV